MSRKYRIRNQDTLYFITFTVIPLFFLFGSFSCKNNTSEPKNQESEQVVLLNMETSSRTGIAKAIIFLQSCGVKMIGVNAIFSEFHHTREDTLLYNSIKQANNVVLVSTFEKGELINSDSVFVKASVAQGLLDYGFNEDGEVTKFRNYIPANNTVLWSFPITVLSYSDFDKGLEIMNRTGADRYYLFNELHQPDASEVISITKIANIPCEKLKNKIVLMGYLGPDVNDDSFTVLSNNDKTKSIKTYNTVILANIITELLSGRDLKEAEEEKRINTNRNLNEAKHRGS